MPSPDSQSSRAIAKKMLKGSYDKTLNERIIKTLEDVPAGVLRALYRHGVRIEFERHDKVWKFDWHTRRITLNPDPPSGLPYDPIKRSLGYAFNHMLRAHQEQRNGGTGNDLWLLSDVAIKHHGCGEDADRLLDCWQNGDTLTLDATKDAAHMFAEGFAYFCTPDLRQQLELRAPRLFELISEFVDRYKGDAPQPQLVQNVPDGGPDIKQAREFAANMLIGWPSWAERERVAKCLQYAPVAVLQLLQRHGIHIALTHGSANLKDGEGEYDFERRCIFLKGIDSGTLLHELGHALDHALFLESAQHDLEVANGSTMQQFTGLGLLFPGRYPLADGLAERWQQGQKVSDYAGKHIGEWFAESFKCSRNAGAGAAIRKGNWEFGDGTRATLDARDPKFISNLDGVMQQLQDGVNITGLPVVKDQPSVQYTQDQTVNAFERLNIDAVRSLKKDSKLRFVAAGALLLFIFTGCAFASAGVVAAAIAFAATLAAVAALGVLLLHAFGKGNLRTAEIIGRSGTDRIVAKDVKGTVIEVDRHLFSGLAQAPEKGETISIRSNRDGKVYAMTERQTAPQNRGAWLPRKKRSAETPNIEPFDTITSPLITPSRVERPTRRVLSRGERLNVAREAASVGQDRSLRRSVLQRSRSTHALEI